MAVRRGFTNSTRLVDRSELGEIIRISNVARIEAGNRSDSSGVGRSLTYAGISVNIKEAASTIPLVIARLLTLDGSHVLLSFDRDHMDVRVLSLWMLQ